jgi:hypothetical protein
MVERRIGKLRILKKFSAARVQQSFLPQTFLPAVAGNSNNADRNQAPKCAAGCSEESSPNSALLVAKYRRIKIENQFERISRGSTRPKARSQWLPFKKQMRPEPATRAALF